MTKFTYTMFVSFLSNTFLSILKIVVGFVGKSSSLVADGIHTFSDLSTDLVSISDDSNDNKSLQKVLNIFTGIVILGLGLVVIYLSIRRTYSIPSIWLVIISLITIILKYILSSYVMEKGVLYNDNLLVNSAKESDNDVFSSIVVFLGLVLMQLSDILPYFRYSDMIASIIVGLFIIKAGFDCLAKEINRLFGTKEVNTELTKQITDYILKNNNVISVDDMIITKYGPYNELKCSINLDKDLSLKKANEITHELETNIRKYYPDIVYIIIKINTNTELTN